jgi:hypothetical protein
MKRFGVILVGLFLLASTLTCTAQDPIPFNELARESSSSFSFVDTRADYDGQTASSTQKYPRRHWTRAGKIMTFIGAPLVAIGGTWLGTTLHKGCLPKDGGCMQYDVSRLADEIWTATGATLTVVGATRRDW